MKKYWKINLFICLFFILISTSNAKQYNLNSDSGNGEETIPDYGYVMGSYLFTNPSTLTYQNLFDAASTVSSDRVILYWKMGDNRWYDTIHGGSATIESSNGEICIDHLNGQQIGSDQCSSSSSPSGGGGSGNTHTVEFTERDFFDDYIDNDPIQIEVADGQTITTYPNVKERPGNKFICWVEDGNSECFTGPVVKNMTLKPKWESIKYTINFDTNGGTGDLQAKEKTCDIGDQESYKNTEGCKFPNIEDVTKEGYEFVGWSLSQDGTVSFYEYDEKNNSLEPALGLEEEITFYAVWKPKDYKIIYDLDGGTYNSLSSITDIYNDTKRGPITLSIKPNKEGYVFKNWELESDNQSDAKIDDSGLTINEGIFKDIHLKAVYDEKKYTIKYVNENSEPIQEISDTECSFTQACKITNQKVEKEEDGYAFVGWTEDGNKGLQYPSDATIKPVVSGDSVENTITLKATFIEIEYKKIITYHLDGGRFDTESGGRPVTEYSPKHQVSLSTPTKYGYEFGGWFDTDEHAKADKAQQEGKIENTEGKEADFEVYARWIPMEYTIKLIDSDSEDLEEKVIATITCTYDEDCTIYSYQITDDEVYSSDSCSVEKDGIRCYYDKNGYTTTGVETSEISFTNSQGEQHKVFTGWSNKRFEQYSSESVGLSIDDGMTVRNLLADMNSPEKEITLYTYTEYKGKSTFDIIYYLDGGRFPTAEEWDGEADSFEEETTEANVGQKITLKAPIKDQKIFAGWRKLDDVTGNIVDEPLYSATLNQKTAFKAIWSDSPSITTEVLGDNYVNKDKDETTLKIKFDDVKQLTKNKVKITLNSIKLGSEELTDEDSGSLQEDDFIIYYKTTGNNCGEEVVTTTNNWCKISYKEKMTVGPTDGFAFENNNAVEFKIVAKKSGEYKFEIEVSEKESGVVYGTVSPNVTIYPVEVNSTLSSGSQSTDIPFEISVNNQEQLPGVTASLYMNIKKDSEGSIITGNSRVALKVCTDETCSDDSAYKEATISSDGKITADGWNTFSLNGSGQSTVKLKANFTETGTYNIEYIIKDGSGKEIGKLNQKVTIS